MQRHSYLVHKAFRSYLFATILASMSLSLGTVVAGIIVGRLLGAQSLSAVNLSAPVMQLFNATYLLFNIGGTILVAMAIGKGNRKEVTSVFSLSMLLNLVVGIVFILLGLCFINPVVDFLCSNETLKPLVKEFSRILLLGAPIFLVLPGICAYVKTDSNPRLASIALIAANVICLILNIVFIKYFHWGLKGAALATTIGFFIGILIAGTHFLRPNRQLSFDIKIQFSKMLPLLAAGLPLAVSSVLLMVRILSVNSIILENLGVVGISILSVCFNLLMLASMFVSGTVQTMLPVSATLYGTQDYEGVRFAIKAAMKTLSICLLSLFGILFMFPLTFALLFGINDPAILEKASSAIRLFAISIPLFGLNYLLMAIYQLISKNKLATFVSAAQALMVIPLLLIASCFVNDTLYWITFAVGELLVFFLVVLIAGRIRKKEPQRSPVILVDYTVDNENVLDVSIESEKKYLSELMESIHQFLVRENVDDQLRNSIEICCEEIVLNILQHGYTDKHKHFIDVKLKLGEKEHWLYIKDDGQPFDPVKYDQQTGIGLLLVRKLCSSIQYNLVMNQNFTTIALTPLSPKR